MPVKTRYLSCVWGQVEPEEDGKLKPKEFLTEGNPLRSFPVHFFCPAEGLDAGKDGKTTADESTLVEVLFASQVWQAEVL